MSHVEIEFTGGVMFSASQYENSTRFRVRNKNSPAWVVVPLDYGEAAEEKVLAFCREHEGRKYDYLGVAGFVFGNPDSESKWFCSEICVAALQEVGMFPGVDASKVSPQAMYEMVTEK